MRKIIFWFHLALGLAAGLVIAWMAATGIVLAFQPLATQWAVGSLATVVPPADTPRLDLDALLGKLREKEGRLPSQFTVRNDPRAAAVAAFGRERTVYVDPYTGEERGEAPARLGAFFATVEHLHRWFALEEPRRDIGKAVTHAAALCFAALIAGGLFLWWRGRSFRLKRGLQGKARDWSLHNVCGFWASPFLLLLALTGVILAYPWANALLFRLAGSPVPPPQERKGFGGNGGGGGGEPVELHAEVWLAAAQAQVPGWQSVSLRLPPRGGKVTLSITEPSPWTPHPVSQLAVDAESGEVVKWEPYAGQSLGRRLRGWVRPLHTGEAFGLPGALVNVLSALAALILVWTGFALSWRRFTRR